MELKRVHQILSESFIKTIKEYNDIYKLLDPLVKQYWEKYEDEWKHYGSWRFSEDAEYIIVDYNYLDYHDNWEWDEENIPINKIIEMIEV